jgi:uncharacterized membrane protein
VTTRQRLPAVDLARGTALLAMVAYHLSWDIAFFGLVGWDMQDGPFWIVTGSAIAGSFLFLVGVGLALAAAGGLDRRRFLLRLLRVAAGAATISVATWFLLPDAWIFFGILHAIALFSVLGLAFLPLPAWLTALAGAAVIVLPQFVADPVFDRPWLFWVGLGAAPPVSNDYEPLFPWFGPVLLGIAAGRRWLAAGAPGGGLRGGAVGCGLRWAGRHSLAVYLLHQPTLIGLLALGLIAAGRDPATLFGPDPASAFMNRCVESCTAGGGGASCEGACACARDAIVLEDLWDGRDARVRDRLAAVYARCGW